MILQKRLSALEAKKPAVSWAWHRIIQQPGQSEDAAIHAYGRDRVAAENHIVLRVIVEPKVRLV